jgi:NAD(P)-dependent dehydrogenase (short-subunit alcohol dehydrogenase family)
MGALSGQVAVVAGATRGAGRGIACALGEAGATVYCTGRSVRGQPSPINRPETVDETADMVSELGGVGVWARVDHTSPDEVRALFERINREQDGRLDILVNDMSGNSELEFYPQQIDKRPFWEHRLAAELRALDTGIAAHFITSYYAAQLMAQRHQGLIVEIGDGNVVGYNNVGVTYSLMKSSAVVLAHLMSEELRQYGVAAVSLTPGFIRSEEILEAFSVREENWRDAVSGAPDFGNSESPFYVGRAVVALATDPKVLRKSGHALSAGFLAREYGFTDVDGTQPPGYAKEGAFKDGLFVRYQAAQQ